MPQSPEAMALSTHSTGTPPNDRVSLSTHCLASSSEAQSRGHWIRESQVVLCSAAVRPHIGGRWPVLGG